MVGGLVGENNFNTTAAVIEYYYATGNVTANYVVGGLVGDNNGSSSIKYCYATGEVNGVGIVGGLAGGNNDASIENCYATGEVTADEYNAGGLVAAIIGRGNDTIRNCYAFNCKVTAGEGDGYYGKGVGRVVGVDLEQHDKSGNIINCYANDAMKLFEGGAAILPIPGSTNHDGDDISYTDAINHASAKMVALFANAGSGAWVPSPYSASYIQDANLPILAAFNKTDFPNALQPPQVSDCNPIFQIWNWADLSYVRWLAENNKLSDYDEYVLMQDLGIPGQPETYGHGDGINAAGKGNTASTPCPYSGERANGYYGYENWATNVGYGSNTTQTTFSLEVGGTDATGIATITQADNVCWATDGSGWLPIGESNPFISSIFDGQNFVAN
jgi:hypothetical protein